MSISTFRTLAIRIAASVSFIAARGRNDITVRTKKDALASEGVKRFDTRETQGGKRSKDKCLPEVILRAARPLRDS